VKCIPWEVKNSRKKKTVSLSSLSSGSNLKRGKLSKSLVLLTRELERTAVLEKDLNQFTTDFILIKKQHKKILFKNLLFNTNFYKYGGKWGPIRRIQNLKRQNPKNKIKIVKKYKKCFRKNYPVYKYFINFYKLRMLEKLPEDKNNTLNYTQYFFKPKTKIKIFKYFNQKDKLLPRRLYKTQSEIIRLVYRIRIMLKYLNFSSEGNTEKEEFIEKKLYKWANICEKQRNNYKINQFGNEDISFKNKILRLFTKKIKINKLHG
jgi:hypothetical protein